MHPLLTLRPALPTGCSVHPRKLPTAPLVWRRPVSVATSLHHLWNQEWYPAIPQPNQPFPIPETGYDEVVTLPATSRPTTFHPDPTNEQSGYPDFPPAKCRSPSSRWNVIQTTDQRSPMFATIARHLRLPRDACRRRMRTARSTSPCIDRLRRHSAWGIEVDAGGLPTGRHPTHRAKPASPYHRRMRRRSSENPLHLEWDSTFSRRRLFSMRRWGE